MEQLFQSSSIKSVACAALAARIAVKTLIISFFVFDYNFHCEHLLKYLNFKKTGCKYNKIIKSGDLRNYRFVTPAKNNELINKF